MKSKLSAIQSLFSEQTQPQAVRKAAVQLYEWALQDDPELNLLHCAVIGLDDHGKMLNWNSEFPLLCPDVKPARGIPISQLFSPEMNALCEASERMVLSSGEPMVLRYNSSLNGSLNRIQVLKVPIDSVDEQLRIIVVCTPVPMEDNGNPERQIESLELKSTQRPGLGKSFQREIERASSSFAALTPRQREVAERLATGTTQKTIAHELDISVSAVEKHRESIWRRLRIQNQADLVRLYTLKQVAEHDVQS